MKKRTLKSQIKRFSLIELLVAIGVIAILAGIALPVMVGMRQRGNEQKARSEIMALETAIKAYETEYGILPIISKTGDTDKSVLDKDEYDILMAFLTQVDTVDGSGDRTIDGCTKDSGNKRKTRFLEVPNSYTDKITAADDKGSYRDPWKNRYIIYLDHDYDGKVDVEVNWNQDSDATDVKESTETLYGSVFIYSRGLKKTGDQNKNDFVVEPVKSWKSGK